MTGYTASADLVCLFFPSGLGHSTKMVTFDAVSFYFGSFYKNGRISCSFILIYKLDHSEKIVAFNAVTFYLTKWVILQKCSHLMR